MKIKGIEINHPDVMLTRQEADEPLQIDMKE